MDHVCEGLVKAFTRGWTTGGVRALGGQRWRRVARGERVVGLQISVADRGRDARRAVLWPVVDARPHPASQFVLRDGADPVPFLLPFLRLLPVGVPVGHG